MSTQLIYPAAIVAAALAVGGCASLPPPNDYQARAEQSLQRAEEVKAMEAAPLEMKSAREKLAQAREAVGREDMEVAAALAQQSTLDAELAIAKQEAADARAVNARLQEGNEVLQQELERNPNVQSKSGGNQS